MDDDEVMCGYCNGTGNTNDVDETCLGCAEFPGSNGICCFERLCENCQGAGYFDKGSKVK